MNGIAGYKNSRILLFCMEKMSCYFCILLVYLFELVSYTRWSMLSRIRAPDETNILMKPPRTQKYHKAPSPLRVKATRDIKNATKHRPHWSTNIVKLIHFRLIPRRTLYRTPHCPSRRAHSQGWARGLDKSLRGLLTCQCEKLTGSKGSTLKFPMHSLQVHPPYHYIYH